MHRRYKMKIIRENGEIKVQSAYNKSFIAKAHQLNGKWSKPYWVFKEETASALNAALVEIYGEGFEQVARVTVEIDLDAWYDSQRGCPNDVTLGGVAIAHRISRDGRVILASDAFVKAGDFLPSGGSAKYPAVTWESGTILVAKVPESVAIGAGVKVVSDADDRKAALEAEKAQLLARLAEVESALASF